jgi:pSer/pThr/pTyr-binding forkhead associated (FHA) protein
MAYWLSVRGAAPFELKVGVDVTIGRGQSCDLCLYSTMLSREHARVRWENGRPVLFDLESLNGTFVGLDRVARHSLRDGDVIRFGDINVVVQVSDGVPTAPHTEDLATREEDTTPAAPAVGEFEPTNETRIYSRTAVLHQRVFEYDEISWLRQHLGLREELLHLDSFAGDDLRRWFAEIGRDEAVLWEFLQVGVLRPSDPKRSLRGLSPDDVVRACAITKRAEKLKLQLTGQRAIWNEMAALRYQVRQGKIFKPLRMVARAYRPGRGLDEVSLKRMVYELGAIYAPDLTCDVLDLELRRLQLLGFVSPTPGRRAEAWFPTDWSDGTCDLAPRGRAMLEGFRLED